MPGSVERKGREVGNDSQAFVLGIWKEDGAENGNRGGAGFGGKMVIPSLFYS